MSDNDKILSKIKKCLALAKSSEPNEAAAALRQAQKLMDMHGISENDVELTDVSMTSCNAGTANTPPQWLVGLIQLVSDTFGVSPLYATTWFEGSKVRFIGVGSQPEVAGYVFDVLYRQLKRERANHVKAQTRCKPATKTRRGDLFAEGWVYGASKLVTNFEQPEKHKDLIKRYMNKTFGEVNTKKARTTSAARGNDNNSMSAGYSAGKKAELNRAMATEKRERIGATQ